MSQLVYIFVEFLFRNGNRMVCAKLLQPVEAGGEGIDHKGLFTLYFLYIFLLFDDLQIPLVPFVVVSEDCQQGSEDGSCCNDILRSNKHLEWTSPPVIIEPFSKSSM